MFMAFSPKRQKDAKKAAKRSLSAAKLQKTRNTLDKIKEE
jgi:hypothetical protein